MRILVTGKNGQLGKSIHKVINNNEQADDFVFVGREELDLSNENNIARYFENNVFDIIINCAAYTEVDKAEEELELANQVNHIAVSQLAKIAKNQQAKLIHISTDYVFDGESEKPYIETDETNPINVYGRTKLAGEQALKEIMPTDAIIIRTSWVYSEYGNNFVKTMLRLGKERDELSVVSDQIGSPTYATDLANAILDIMQNKTFKEVGQETQVYHYSNEGEISWYEFAKEVFELARVDCKVNSINTDQYPTPAQRPAYVVMDKTSINLNYGLSIYHWKPSLENCQRNLALDIH
jgi:dTDP-4-dehydrorhamnose reductase